jgi:hypothetical protein
MHRGRRHLAGGEAVWAIEGSMPRPTARYSLVVKDHVTLKQLKVELIELPVTENRRFRLRVNGQWARKVPVGSGPPARPYAYGER